VEAGEFPATASLKIKRDALAERLRQRERGAAIVSLAE
jgi:hypothetical protein